MPRNSSSCSARHARFNAQQFGLQSTFWLNVKTCTFVVSHSGCAFTLHKHLMFVWSRKLRLPLRKRKKNPRSGHRNLPHDRILKRALFLSPRYTICPVLPFRKSDCSQSYSFPITCNLIQSPQGKGSSFLGYIGTNVIPHGNTNPENNNHLSNNLTDDLETSKRFPLYNLFPDDQI